MFFDNLPQMINSLDRWLTGCCFFTENLFRLPRGFLVKMLREMLVGGGKAMKDAAMPFLMVNSMTVVRCFVEVTVMTIILFIATILSLQEMEDIRMRRENSIFRHEFALLGQQADHGRQCMAEDTGKHHVPDHVHLHCRPFSLWANQYSLLLGIGIGLLDALPIFGTGTVLIPLGSVSPGKWRLALRNRPLCHLYYLLLPPSGDGGQNHGRQGWPDTA